MIVVAKHISIAYFDRAVSTNEQHQVSQMTMRPQELNTYHNAGSAESAMPILSPQNNRENHDEI